MILMPAGIVYTAMYALDSLCPSMTMLLSILAILASHRAVLQPFRDGLHASFAHSITFRGQSVALHSILGERRLPLADIVAVDVPGRALVTVDYRHIRLAPRAPEALQEQLVAVLSEQLAHRAGGTADDVPEALRALQRPRQPAH